MKKEEFELKKFKIDTSGTKTEVIVHYLQKVVTDQGEELVKCENTYSRVPHPDMEDALKALVPIMADANDLKVHRSTKLMPALREIMESKDGERIMKLWDSAINDSITVTGVSIQGDTEEGSTVITGKRKIHHTGCALNSPKINFNGDSFGFEASLPALIERVISEAFEFVENDKRKDPELFGESSDKKEDEDAA